MRVKGAFSSPLPAARGKTAQSAIEIVALAKELHASGMLKRDWDSSRHPRWPAGSPDSVGGRFAPGRYVDTAPTDESHTPIRTAQAGAIPIPFDLIAPRGMPVPSEIVPPLSIYPRRELINPYPDRPGCEEEWADALAYCWKPKERKQLGKGDNRGSGRTFEKCVLGRVSERCGGNPTA